MNTDEKVCTVCRGPITVSDQLVPSGTSHQVVCPEHGLNYGIPAVTYSRENPHPELKR